MMEHNGQTGEVLTMSEVRAKRRLRTGYIIFGALVSIKIVEYLISKTVPTGNWPYLAILALISAWLIIYLRRQ